MVVIAIGYRGNDIIYIKSCMCDYLVSHSCICAYSRLLRSEFTSQGVNMLSQLI